MTDFLPILKSRLGKNISHMVVKEIDQRRTIVSDLSRKAGSYWSAGGLAFRGPYEWEPDLIFQYMPSTSTVARRPSAEKQQTTTIL
eukprot:10861543-Heterocapsa_arctica.AAC.1